MTDTPTPGEAAALPVYAWLNPREPFAIDAKMRAAGMPFFKDCTEPLVRLSDAQSIIDRLTAEADELRRKWLGHRDTGHLSLIEAADQVIGGLQAELADRQAAALPTIEAIMDLAEKYARAATLDERVTFEHLGMTEEENAEMAMNEARESLRAALARALPVGEERDAASHGIPRDLAEQLTVRLGFLPPGLHIDHAEGIK